MKRRAAFSLLELQISSFVLLMVLAAIYVVMKPGFRYFAQGNVHAGVQQEVMKGMLALKGDLGDSQRSNIHIATAPVSHCWFLSARPVVTENVAVSFSDSGLLEWRKWMCYFYDPSNQRILRSELPLPAASADTTTVVPRPLTDFQDELGPSRKVVARSIASFGVIKVSDNLYRIHVESQAAVTSDQSTAVKLETEVWVRNE